MAPNNSENFKLKICRICLEIVEFEQAEELNPAKVEMLKLLNLGLNPTIAGTSFFLCSSCSVQLTYSVEFKMACLRNIVYFKVSSPRTENFEETKIRVCKLCSEYWKIGNLVPISCNGERSVFDRNAIIKCFSEVDVLFTQESLICPNCIGSLNKLSNFLLTCSGSNKIINEYIGCSNGDPLCVHMFNVFEYKLNRKNNSEIATDMNANEIVNQECQNNNEQVCHTDIKEEVDCITFEENELPVVKKEYSDDESNDIQVQWNTIELREKNEKQYYCYHCNYKTHVKATLITHLILHQSTETTETFKCSSCDFVSKWRTSVRTHELLHKDSNEVKKYMCKKCPYKSIYRKHLRRHMEKHSLKKYYCEECSFRTKNLGPFKSHNRRKHNKTIDIVYSEFEDDDTLMMRKNRLKRMYKCSHCPYETHKCSRIKEHITKHLKDDEVTWFKCNCCEFKSRYRASVNHHQRLHSQGKTVRLKNRKYD